MIFTDVCFISNDVIALAKFYEEIFQIKCDLDSIHTFVKGPGLNIAIYNQGASEKDGFEFTNAGRGFAYIGFDVEDVDAEYERLNSLNVTMLSQPTLWPWGAKSFRFNDPDENAIVFRSWPKQS